MFKTSSFCPPVPGCVEVDLEFKKSTLCGFGGCVEVAGGKNLKKIAVRDSKDPNSPVLLFNSGEWKAFIAGVKKGEFDIF